MKNILVVIVFIFSTLPLAAQRVDDFQLKDAVSGNTFSLGQHKSATAVVLIFTTNTCPFSKLYEGRIADLADRFSSNNIQFVLINPHVGMDGESVADMANKAQSDLRSLPYLADNGQKVAQAIGITKIPEVVVITSGPTGYGIVYQGAIDNNPQLPQSATRKHLEIALTSISEKKSLKVSFTRATGCNLRSH